MSEQKNSSNRRVFKAEFSIYGSECGQHIVPGGEQSQ